MKYTQISVKLALFTSVFSLTHADFLIAHGQIDYHPPGFVYGNTLHINSNTVVNSPGVGLDYNLPHNFAIKGDVQFQHRNTPVTASGTIHPTAVTLGVVYNFDFN